MSFDLCEIIAWTGAPRAPTTDQLGRLIRQIGPERVLFGTDFPWYELDRTIDQLMSLPHLSDEEQMCIRDRPRSIGGRWRAGLRLRRGGPHREH